MKYIKTLIFIACLPLFLVSCDSNDDLPINTANATIEFENSSITVKETTTFINIPVNVIDQGARNGDIIMHVKVKASSDNVRENQEIILTTQTIRIPAEKNSMNVELGLRVENRDTELNRYLTLELTDVQGASIGANSEYTVYITEKNYIEGTYLIRGLNPFDGLMSSGNVTVIAGDETLNKISLDFGLGGTAKVTFSEVIPDRLYNISIAPFSLVGTYNGNEVYLSWAKQEDDGKTVEHSKDNPIRGKFEKLIENGIEVQRFTFDKEHGFGLVSLDNEGNVAWYQYDTFVGIPTMTQQN